MVSLGGRSFGVLTIARFRGPLLGVVSGKSVVSVALQFSCSGWLQQLELAAPPDTWLLTFRSGVHLRSLRPAIRFDFHNNAAKAPLFPVLRQTTTNETNASNPPNAEQTLIYRNGRVVHTFSC